MIQRKRRPKQNFEIGHKAIIEDNKLNTAQKIMLQNILINHKENVDDYKHILNQDFIDVLGIGATAFNKYRDELESLKLIKIKVKINGKSVEVKKSKRKNSPLLYYPQWEKLERFNFIKTIDESNKFKNNFAKKTLPKNKLPLFKEGHIFTIDDKDKIIDKLIYEIRQYELSKEETRLSTGYVNQKCYGNELKRIINSLNHNKQCEYEFIQTIK